MATPPHWYTDGTSQITDATTKITALSQAQGNASYFADSLADLKAAQTDLDSAWTVVQQLQQQATDQQSKSSAAIADLQSKLNAANAALAKAKQGGASPPNQGVTATNAQGQLYISSGAVAGIALGALALGGVGGYVLKGALAKRKEARELEEGERAAEKKRLKKKGAEE